MKQKSILRTLFISGVALGATLLAHAAPSFDEAPVPLQAIPPVLSDSLRAAGLNGMVSIKVTVDESGNVTQATVAKSSNSQFDQPALDAVSRWKFRPAKKEGRAVASNVVVPIRFSSDS